MPCSPLSAVRVVLITFAKLKQCTLVCVEGQPSWRSHGELCCCVCVIRNWVCQEPYGFPVLNLRPLEGNASPLVESGSAWVAFKTKL